MVFPRAHGRDETGEVPPTTSGQEIGNPRVRRCEPKSWGCRMSAAIIISCAGGPEGVGFVGQISRRRGPVHELALGRYGDCSLSTVF